MQAKRKFVYKKRDEQETENGRTAKCGHFSPSGRYFACENCKPTLEDDVGDWVYNDWDTGDDDIEEDEDYNLSDCDD